MLEGDRLYDRQDTYPRRWIRKQRKRPQVRLLAGQQDRGYNHCLTHHDYSLHRKSAVFHIEPLEAAGRMILERAKKVLKEENCSDAHFVLRKGSGNPGHEIIKFGEEENISLIVMSAKGHSALAHLLTGSVSDMVVKHAPCHILIVKQEKSKK